MLLKELSFPQAVMVEWHMESPDTGNGFSPGTWFWFYSMAILLPAQMHGRNESKAAGDFVEGYFMFLYTKGAECRRSRRAFFPA